ncbi:MAG: peptidylprolyl isomerase [Rhodococcus sp.]|nr:peptidylprolyl isomerase [Rhodococcus sp. (in: high G+C Gram-positive bacteria)]
MKRTPLIAGAAALILALGACSNDEAGDDATATAGSASASTSTELTTVEAPAPMDMSAYADLPAIPSGPATVDCTYPAATPPARPVEAPETTDVSAEGTVTVDVTTTSGPIGLELNRQAAPCTVNSFVSLAEQGYFNDTECHRLVYMTGMQIVQCGDPTATGTGGPGYGFDTEYPQTAVDPAQWSEPAVYPRGTIAMANSGRPGTNGSQFFLVFADTVLPPQYTVFGTMDDAGIETLESIAVYGDDGSMGAGGGTPAKSISLETVTVK